MPPILALLLTVGFVVWLFRWEFREHPDTSRALWLPVIWMTIISSRTVGQWLGELGIHIVGGSMEEGSPFDALIFLVLIVLGLRVLARRQASLGELFRNNRMLMVYFIFCLVSVAWSDFPLVAFKRWTKVLGQPVMALIVLTDANPIEALSVLMRRCGILLLPLSITLMKYFPEIGRGFDDWGLASNNGVARNKNELGCICMLWALFYFWSLVKAWHMERGPERKSELKWNFGFLYLIGYLLVKAHCATAIVCMSLAGVVFLAAGLKWVQPQRLGLYIVGVAVAVVLEESIFGLSSVFLGLLGRNADLTGRTLLWHELLEFHINPILGAGYESFWLGSRLDALWAAHWWHPTEAHNGYLETFLNAGGVGVVLLLGLLVATFGKARAELLRDFEFGRLRLALFVAMVAYNWTEAAFKGLSPVFFLFLLIAIDYPSARVVVEDSLPSHTLAEEGEMPYFAS